MRMLLLVPVSLIPPSLPPFPLRRPPTFDNNGVEWRIRMTIEGPRVRLHKSGLCLRLPRSRIFLPRHAKNLHRSRRVVSSVNDTEDAARTALRAGIRGENVSPRRGEESVENGREEWEVRRRRRRRRRGWWRWAAMGIDFIYETHCYAKTLVGRRA